MKTLYLISILSIIFCTSCSVSKLVNAPATTVENIVSIEQGMSLTSLNTTLGIQPYNVYHLSENDKMLLVYNYRLKDQRLDLPASSNKRVKFIHGQESFKGGEDWYQKESQELFVLLADKKVVSFLTGKGAKNSEYLAIVGENLRIIEAKEHDKLKMMMGEEVSLIPIGRGTQENNNKPQFFDISKKGKGGKIAVGTLVVVGAAAVVGALLGAF